MSRSRYRIFETEYPYFLTCTIVGWLPIFTRPVYFDFIYRSWKWLEEKEGLTIYGYVILENHLHLIAQAPDLANVIARFKSFTKRQIIDHLEALNATTVLQQLKMNKENHKTDRPYQLWQEGSHPKQIQNDEMMLQKLEYIHNNPLARGYVDDPVHWRHSSARNYFGLPGLISVQTDWR